MDPYEIEDKKEEHAEKHAENYTENHTENQRNNRTDNRKETGDKAGFAGPAGFITLLFKGLVVLECLILAIGTCMSFITTLKVTKLSARYFPFFLLTLLGVLLIALLIRFFKKKWTPLLGIVLILIYLFSAGYGYYLCELNAGRLKRLAFYQGREVVLTVDGERYVWNGQAKYGSRDLVSMSENRTASIKIGEETKNIALSSLSVRNGEESRIYYQIYCGATGDYLVLEKSDNIPTP